MRVLHFVFSLYLIIFTVQGCKDIPRDNIFDPRNPNSMREQQILLEAFVNTNTILADSVIYNQNMMTALSRLEIKYGAQIIVAVHHRDLFEYQDSLAIFESEDIYARYVEAFDDAVKGVPDVFINGLGARIQGATSAASAEYRIESALQPFLIQNSHFTIEPEVILSAGTLNCSVTIARLGATTANDILVKAFILQNVDDLWQRKAVRAIRRSNLIPALLPGERRELTFNAVTGLADNPTSVVIAVISADEFTVYQGVEIRL